MSKDQLAWIGIRLLALYLFITGFSGVSNILPAASTLGGFITTVYYVVAPSLVMIILSVILWIWTGSIVRLMLRGSGEDANHGSAHIVPSDWMDAAFAVFGVILAVMMIPRMIIGIIHLIDVMSMDTPNNVFAIIDDQKRVYIFQLIQNALYLLIALALIGKARHLSARIRKFWGDTVEYVKRNNS